MGKWHLREKITTITTNFEFYIRKSIDKLQIN